jgi:hypothetical protein
VDAVWPSRRRLLWEPCLGVGPLLLLLILPSPLLDEMSHSGCVTLQFVSSSRMMKK